MKRQRVWLLLLLAALTLTGCSGSGSSQSAEPDDFVVISDDEDVVEETDGDLETEDDEEEAQEETAEVSYPYDYSASDFFAIEGAMNYAPLATLDGVLEDGNAFTLDGEDGYQVMQGGCTDGTYAYLLLENKYLTNDAGETVSYCKLYKVDMETWEVADVSEPLAVDHGNGITYNVKTGQLLVAHCNTNTQRVSFVDPDTLTVTGYKDVGRNIYTIAYNETYDEYVAGIKGTNNYIILDADLNQIDEITGIDPTACGDVAYQNIAVDDDYIYIGYTGDYEMILCYDWNGYYCGVFRVDSYSEQEAMFCVNDVWYMSFYSGNGGRVYQLNMDKNLMF
ncbi:MAG: hypothetical protein LUE90_02340 [Clostridiales bacterium]|nr:hypothetical protein [Clostridiales bacterium]